MTLETLLNKLIELWWKPRGIEKPYCWNNKLLWWICINLQIKSYRDLVSMESGLWQFVCEKWLLYKLKRNINICINVEEPRQEYDEPITWYECDFEYSYKEYAYRLMLSSIQEDIENFLLDNIKIEDDTTK